MFEVPSGLVQGTSHADCQAQQYRLHIWSGQEGEPLARVADLSPSLRLANLFLFLPLSVSFRNHCEITRYYISKLTGSPIAGTPAKTFLRDSPKFC
jgi:hypothetical protein